MPKGRPRLDFSEEKWTVTTSELGHLFGSSPQLIAYYCGQGLPKKGRGQFHLPECIKWLREWEADRARRDTGDVAQERAALYRTQREKLELDIEKDLGTLILADEARTLLMRYAQAFIDVIDAIPSRVQFDAEHEQRLTAEITQARRDLADETLAIERTLSSSRQDIAAATGPASLAMGGGEETAATG